MNNYRKKIIAAFLCMGMVLGSIGTQDALAASSDVKLAKKSMELTVTKTAKKISYGSAKIIISKGKSVKVTKVSYKSKDKKIAKVTKKGKVTAVKVGKTTVLVKVTYKKNKKKYTKNLKQKVVVKLAANQVTASPAPTQKTTTSPVPTKTPTVAPTAAPTAEPTPVPETTFKYKHDPQLYDEAMADVVVDKYAIYGFAPNPESTRLGEYAKYNWSDEKVVADGRADRIAYHKSIQSMYTMLDEMRTQGKDIETIARAISAERNRIRLAAYEGDPEGLETVKKSNLEKYGDENGPTAESLYEKYGSWETVLSKSFSPNIGMDICLGLYDDYFDSYIALGILTPKGEDIPATPTPNPTAAPILNEGNITYAESVVGEMCKPSYWINKSKTPDKELITREEIDQLNTDIIKAKDTSMNNLVGIAETYNGNSLKNSLGNQATPDLNKLGHVNGVAMTNKEAYYQAMRDNILAADTTESDTIKYALVVKRANMKSWPTSDIIGNSATDTDDEAQLSAAIVNEPLVAKTITGDGKYTYVFSSNCQGWVETECLAFCQNKDEWLEAWNATGDNFLVVTTDKIILEESYIEGAVSKVELSLSTKLNLVPKAEVPRNVNERGTWNNYVVYLPTRDADGNYVKKMALIPQRYNVSVGYLPVTERNILNIAFECLGSRYGWGGMLNSMDCSAYTSSIYRCFGINLPRNTTGQPAIPTKNYHFAYETETDEQGVSEKKMVVTYGGEEVARTSLVDAQDKKREILDTLPAGTLLRFSGHIVMYIGQENGKYYCINDLGSLYKEEGTEDSTSVLYQYSVVINTLDVRRGSLATDGSKTWLSHFTDFVCPWAIQ